MKTFYGTSPNAVKIQIWVSMVVYCTLAILKERYQIEYPLSKMLHFLEVNLFEQKSLELVFELNPRKVDERKGNEHIQLQLFDNQIYVKELRWKYKITMQKNGFAYFFTILQKSLITRL